MFGDGCARCPALRSPPCLLLPRSQTRGPAAAEASLVLAQVWAALEPTAGLSVPPGPVTSHATLAQSFTHKVGVVTCPPQGAGRSKLKVRATVSVFLAISGLPHPVAFLSGCPSPPARSLWLTCLTKGCHFSDPPAGDTILCALGRGEAGWAGGLGHRGVCPLDQPPLQL